MNAPVSATLMPAAHDVHALASSCFHCGEAVTAGSHWQVELEGRVVSLCCPGCAAATSAIRDFGLGEYYRHRDNYAPRPVHEDLPADRYQVYDDAQMLARFADSDGTVASAELTLAGMSCAACAWLLESRLARVHGVECFEVNFSARRARLRWREADIDLSHILAVIATLGYDARPYTPDARRTQIEAQSSALLRALGVAALFGMQVMMIAFAFYSGGIEPAMQRFLRWTSLVLSLPMVVYCAWPFYRSAWAALRAGGLVMEVPVAIAIVLAFAGSVWNTVLDQGAVYYDSVSMFVTLLLASRYLEMRARAAASTRLEAFTALVPDGACRIRAGVDGERFETVPAMRLAVGDRVLVRAGETIPADGVVSEGSSAVDESILTGEALPQTRGPGARVLGGSINLESVLRIEVSAVAAESFAGHLAQLVNAASQARPTGVELSQRAARWFVAAILLVSVATAWFWWQHDATRWFSTTLAVLVVSCPCALAIAVPAALAAAHSSLLGEGIAVLDGRALERLAAVTHCLFDKTGTLTVGRLMLRAVECCGDAERDTVLQLAAALAQNSNHPIARALRLPPGVTSSLKVEDSVSVTGAGMSGYLDGVVLALGSKAYIASLGIDVSGHVSVDTTQGKEAWLARDGRLLARLVFDDRLRDDAATLFHWLREQGYVAAIVSGDRLPVVAALARACGVEHFQAARTPADKRDHVAALQRDGAVILMVGDGVNDAPVLAQADVSIAVADSAASARQQASVLLLTPRLSAIPRLLVVARRTQSVMRQNLWWAVLYNIIALPLAAAAWLAPWAAALGMSLSSLVVVLNALRLVRR